MGIRRKSRELAVQALYIYDVSQSSISELISFGWVDKEYDSRILLYASDLIKGTIESIDDLDNAIKNHIKDDLTIKRMGLIEKAILRVMGYEMLKMSIPDAVAINEAVEIAKKFGTDYSHKFVNGILDGIRKEQANKEEEK